MFLGVAKMKKSVVIGIILVGLFLFGGCETIEQNAGETPKETVIEHQEPEVKVIYIEEKEEKPIENQTEEVNIESEENTLMETALYYFELSNKQLVKDTIITIKFDDDKWKTGILDINGNKAEIGQTNSTYSLYINRWVETGGNYYQIKEYNSSFSKIKEINVKSGGNYVSLKYSPELK